jgi:NAD+ kinase
MMPPADAKALALDDLAMPVEAPSPTLAVSLGGDGTVLRAVQLLDGAPVPLLAVNVGLLGYLAELEAPGLLGALERWFAADVDADIQIEERMMLDAVVRRAASGDEQRWRALNEGVVEKDESGHMVRLLVSIDGTPFTSYAADGLIVATPTGSTAYSLSAHGPVISPRHRAMLLTPVSPHMLFDRSLVLDPDEEIRVEVIGQRPARLSIDGRPVATLAEGDAVSFRPSVAVARFVRFGRRRFHQILKTKFGLADR